MRSFSFYLHRVVPMVAIAIGAIRVDSFADASNTDFFDAPSFFGIKEAFYNFAPHQEKEDLLPPTRQQDGTGKPFAVKDFVRGGMTRSGDLSMSDKSPQPQSQERIKEQFVRVPMMQQEFTEYSNPLLNHFGGPKYPQVPFRHTMPHNVIPTEINPLTFADRPYMTGAPASDLVEHALRLSASQKTAQKLLDPSFQSAQAAYQGTMQQTADATADDAAGGFDSNLHSTADPIPNVANEAAATPTNGKQSKRSVSQAIWIVQEMYKRFFMPFSLLLLLVGTVITQTSNFVGASFLKFERGPLEGLLRAAIAIFLIPATQLMVSYFIDFGNAMTDPIKRAVDTKSIADWSRKITHSKAGMKQSEIDKRNNEESTMASTTRAVFGSVHAILNSALMVLGVFQLVMVCYLFLLGPIAASMFAWPDCVGSLFRPVFANWLNALSNVVLWKFWWCTILLCMATRIHWLQETGGLNFSSPWEPVVYTAFLVMLGYVPFSALDFKPGDMVDALLEKAGKRSA